MLRLGAVESVNNESKALKLIYDQSDFVFSKQNHYTTYVQIQVQENSEYNK